MDAKYGLIIKRGDADPINTYTKWGIACVKAPFRIGGKAKELPKRNWYDEHGDDVYMPEKLMFEGYDVEFELACVVDGNVWNLSESVEKIADFKKWISGNDTENGSGSELQIYSSYTTIGRKGCYLLEFSDEDVHLQLKQKGENVYDENVLTFKVKFRVTDPMTDITLSVPSAIARP